MVDNDEEFLAPIVTNYHFDKEGNFFKTRITLSPHMIMTIEADEEPVAKIDSRDLKNVMVCMLEGRELRLLLNEIDLMLLERSVGR